MHQNFASRLLAHNDSEAASLLLRCGTTSSSGEYGEHLYAEDASFSREQPTTTSVAVPRRGSFTSAENMSVPDNAPGSDSSSVYRFVLQAAQATALNAALRHDAIEQSQSSRGIQVSNAGGFHGKTTTLDPKASDAWYGPLRKVIVEALHTLHVDGLVAGCRIELLHLTGWVNVSLRGSFNQPHDHGAVPLSCVYFVDGGGPPPPGFHARVSPDGPNSSRRITPPPPSPVHATTLPSPAGCAGELLFQTQPLPNSNRYTFFSVLPIPGTLFLFPGYMPHAVLPRSNCPLQRAEECDGQEGMPTASLRISVACNIYGYQPADLPPDWKSSRRS